MRRSLRFKYPGLVAGTFLLCALLSGYVLTAHAATPTGFQSDFVETRTLPGFDTPLVSHGRVQFDAQGFRWEITAPYHYVFEMHGNHADEQLPDGQVRQLDPAKAPWLIAVKQLLGSALSGNPAQLDKYFTAKITPLAHGRRLLLTPKPGALAQAIGQIEVTESAPGHPEELVIHESGGGRLDIRFSPSTP